MIEKHNISIQKTARYFTYGNLSENTRYVWIVCHGYGQLANYFLKKFTFLSPEIHYIIAPEGLHRFYWGGFNGKVVASWMTKEDREDDIQDYIRWLDKLYEHEIKNKITPKQKIIVLGFSQGTATISRWISKTKHSINYIIWYAGNIPDDSKFDSFKTKTCFCVAGDNDVYISQEEIQKVKQKLELESIFCEWIHFKGGHEIVPEVLLNVIDKIT